MPICNICSTHFSNRVCIDGKIRNLCNRKYCLECSPYGLHNTRKLSERKEIDDKKYCPSCKVLKEINQFYIHRDGRSSYCKLCSNSLAVKRFRKAKELCVEYKGGKCIICNYNKCIGALEFHHIDPKIKDFSISNSKNCHFNKLKPELDKCVLLCCRCHREVENGITKIP